MIGWQTTSRWTCKITIIGVLFMGITIGSGRHLRSDKRKEQIVGFSRILSDEECMQVKKMVDDVTAETDTSRWTIQDTSDQGGQSHDDIPWSKVKKFYQHEGFSGMLVESLNDDEMESVMSFDFYNMTSDNGILKADQKECTLHAWGMDRANDGQNLKLDNICSNSNNGRDVNIFVLDTGCDLSHQELKSRGERETVNIFSVLYDGTQPNNNDRAGHGTHVAGIAAGYKFGMAPGANLYCGQVLDYTGRGTVSDLIDGLLLVLDWYNDHNRPPTIVNMSMGQSCEGECHENNLFTVLRNLRRAGIILTASAGNLGGDACSYIPASSPDVIAVGATDFRKDQIASFSNTGQCVDIYAPGVKIPSAKAETNKYLLKCGTSMAAPAVAGIVAQLLNHNRNRNFNGVLNDLECYAVKDALEGSAQEGSKNILVHVPDLAGSCLPPNSDKGDLNLPYIDPASVQCDETFTLNEGGTDNGARASYRDLKAVSLVLLLSILRLL